jgi:arginyl-tRNA synthetase
MTIPESLQNRLRGALKTALAAHGIHVDADEINIEYPADFSHGDYATGAAMRFAKHAGMSPRDLAEKLVATLGTIDGFEKIEIAGPGFINFTLSTESITQQLIHATDERWGKGMSKERVILLEYTSPNLFKPLHIGNLVGNVLGESIARLYEFSGYTVKRANYPSDIGLTVAKGVWGLKRNGADPGDIKALGAAYRDGNEAYETDEGAKAEIIEINKKLYARSDEELSVLRDKGIETSRRHLDELCKTLGTTFDIEIFESEAAPIGTELVREYTGDVFEVSEGATVFHGEMVGLHTRVFLNSAGLPTYEAKDLGNFALKMKAAPESDELIVITGSEQSEYFKVVIEAIRRVFPQYAHKILRHIANPFLTLTTGKMSSRKGNVLTGEDLINELVESAKERAKESRAENIDTLAREVSVAALKFQILKQGTGKSIVFDKERALSLEGDSGPYLQYAHARAHQIVERARAEGIEGMIDPTIYGSNELQLVMRLIHRFPEIVESAVSLTEPHVVTTYLIELASAYNSWYAQEQILDGTPAAAHKVAVVNAVRQTLKNGLWVLGIPAPEKM